ncbi:MAG: SDR family oxidoreductase [Schleiferiaceae bacterium]|jgi:short-subunit dehydrogenase|nr:SDR family oxidoreductase [Schleiferiaceae bacterium]
MSKLGVNPEGKIALVSGANRGIGKAIVLELLANGIAKVYAGARNTEALKDLTEAYGDRVVPVHLDVTDLNSIAALSKSINDIDILVNNAGVFSIGKIFSETAVSSLKENFDVNVWGVLGLTKAFEASLQKESNTAVVNISSLAGLGNMPMAATYSVSKAAVHSLTQGMRAELADKNALVVGVYPGPIDTDMAAALPMEKDSPENVAKDIVNALKEGTEDVFPDVMSKEAGAYYANSPKGVEQQFATFA